VPILQVAVKRIQSHSSDIKNKMEKLMSTEAFLLQKFGPLLSMEQLAGLLDRSVDGLRLSLAQDGEISQKFGPARKKIGRRVYFRSSMIASVLDAA
jgi:hypothetical protein